MSRTLSQEVQFYLDRSQEALITLLRSILTNPRLTPEEQFTALKSLGEHHRQIWGLVEGKLAEGERKGLELAYGADEGGVR